MTKLQVNVAPRMSRVGFIEVLVAAGSPAAPVAGEIYDLLVEGGLDPAVGLAFFQHESTYGTKGKAIQTRNWGNLRWAPVDEQYADFVTYWTDPETGKQYPEWAWFAVRPDKGIAEPWYRSADAWRRLISEVYIRQWKVPPYVEDILRLYAPIGDGSNYPPAYTAAVHEAVQGWAAKYPPGPTLEDRVVEVEELVDRLDREVGMLHSAVSELADRVEVLEGGE